MTRRKKHKRIKPDEIYVNGPFSMARFGNVTVSKNFQSEEEHAKSVNRMAEMYPTVVSDISQLVRELADEVVKYEPVSILRYSYWACAVAALGKTTEPDFDEDDALKRRMIDYIQCLIVSTPTTGEVRPEISEEQWDYLLEKVRQLYRKLNFEFHACDTAVKIRSGTADHEYERIYVQAQIHWANVRGSRYSIHDIPHIRDLLMPHDEVFKRLFSLSMDEFISGLERIQWSLIAGPVEAKGDFDKVQESFLESLSNKQEVADPSDLPKAFLSYLEKSGLKEQFVSATGRLFEDDLFDVGLLTRFPPDLMRELAWSPGEDPTFFAEGDFPGWPLRSQPINVRPFLKVGSRYYCFDVYSLFDKIYRIIQRLIIRLEPGYAEEWKLKQQATSELLPVTLLCRLLPGGTVYRSVYYRDEKGNPCEADALIVFDKTLFVVEVKAGAFTHSPPTTDFRAYMESIKTLIYKPSMQAKRFLGRLDAQGEVTLYRTNAMDEELGTIRKSDIDQFAPLSITLDNLTHLASQAENLTAVGSDLGSFAVWSISVDDLRVYSDVFDSPSRFLHFVEQRFSAIKSPSLAVTDEIDHLGLYLEFNDYALNARLLSQQYGSGTPMWHGYSRHIDQYFHALLSDPESATAPVQNCPKVILDIIRCLEIQGKYGFTKIGRHLLSLDGGTRQMFEEGIERAVARQHEIGRICPLNFVDGEAAITMYCRTSDTIAPSAVEATTYCLGVMRSERKTEWLVLDLDFDEYDKVVGADWKHLTDEDISDANRQEVEKVAERLRSMKTETHGSIFGRRKIGRNDLCPCGSSKKFKRCHGSALH